MRAPYPVTLTQLDDGSFHVRVGCKELSYDEDNLEGLIEDIRRYFEDPKIMIEEFARDYGWNLNEPAIGIATPSVYNGGATVGRR